MLTSVHVIVETTITIPHWQPRGVTSPARRTWWADIQAAVTRHEHEHVFIAEQGGKAIAASLIHLSAPTSAAPKPDQRAALRELHSLHDLAFAVDDVVEQAGGRGGGGPRNDPDVPLEI